MENKVAELIGRSIDTLLHVSVQVKDYNAVFQPIAEAIYYQQEAQRILKENEKKASEEKTDE